MLGNRATTWDIELEDGILPSDSSSLAYDTTVVVDTGRIWGLRGGMRQPLQSIVDACGEPRSLKTRSPDDCSHPSPRVASRFFPKCVSAPGFRRDSTPDCGDLPNREYVSLTLDGCPDYPRPDVEWDDSLGQETDLFLSEHHGAHPSPLAGACICSS